jgi:hypothetical protein
MKTTDPRHATHLLCFYTPRQPHIVRVFHLYVNGICVYSANAVQTHAGVRKDDLRWVARFLRNPPAKAGLTRLLCAVVR